MSRLEAFIATVGVLLIENNPCKPWRSPLPPALQGARGWYMPTAAGPMLLFILPADELASVALAEAIAQWQAWLSALRASESVLLLTWDDGLPEDLPLDLPAPDDLWQVWLVDLPAQQASRSGTPPEDRGFQHAVDSILTSYFRGSQYALADLAEQERAREDGQLPYGTFLRRQATPASWAIMGLIGGMYLLSELAGGSSEVGVLLRMGANFHPLIANGEVWRLVTANFLHIGLMHLAVNGYSLFVVGPMLEKLYGTSKFLAIYVFAGLTGAVASFFFNPGSVSAGASGALFGLLGAMLILGLHHHDSIPDHEKRNMRTVALVTLLVNLALGFKIPGLDNFCHMGGLVGGAAIAALLGPHPALLGRRPARFSRPLLAIFPLVAIAGLLAGLWSSYSGKVSTLRFDAASHDYAIQLPLYVANAEDMMQAQLDGSQMVVSADGNRHYILIRADQNRAEGANGKQTTFFENRLEAQAGEIAGEFTPLGAQLAAPARVVSPGAQRFVKLAFSMKDGTQEEEYVAVSANRLFLVRTKGLEQAAWMRPTLDQVLTSFKVIAP